MKNKVLNFSAFLMVFAAVLVNVERSKAQEKAGEQVCESKLEETTPAKDFTIHNNGTVTHKPTNLMWKVCAEGQVWQSVDGSCTGTPDNYDWYGALLSPQFLNSQNGYAGYVDWRVPNVKELVSIVERSCDNPAVNSLVFSNSSWNLYWSSSPYAYLRTSSSDRAWGVNFIHGNRRVESPTMAGDGYTAVRLVRNVD